MVDVLRAVVRVVVFHFVVVPREDPRARGMGGLQVRIRLVQGVARAVVVERVGLGGRVLAHVVAAPGRFVDVVAQERDEIEVVPGHMPVGAEVALLVMLAGGKREPQLVRLGGGAGRGARAPDRARRVARREAVPVPAGRLEAADFDVNRMRPVRRGVGGAGSGEVREFFVAGDFPAHRHNLGGHAAAGRVRHGREARPQHDRIGERIARRDAEAERVGRETRPGLELGQ